MKENLETTAQVSQVWEIIEGWSNVSFLSACVAVALAKEQVGFKGRPRPFQMRGTKVFVIQ